MRVPRIHGISVDGAAPEGGQILWGHDVGAGDAADSRRGINSFDSAEWPQIWRNLRPRVGRRADCEEFGAGWHVAYATGRTRCSAEYTRN